MSHPRKLTPEDHSRIRARWAIRDTYKSLADEFGTTWRNIQSIISNTNRKKRDKRYRDKLKATQPTPHRGGRKFN